jgi:copper chaperone CopZ
MPDSTARTRSDDPARRESARQESLSRDSLLVVPIDGMHSYQCEQAIKDALSRLPGVRETEVDFPSAQASIIFEARKITAHQLVEAIEQAGYRCGEHALGSGGGRIE